MGVQIGPLEVFEPKLGGQIRLSVEIDGERRAFGARERLPRRTLPARLRTDRRTRRPRTRGLRSRLALAPPGSAQGDRRSVGPPTRQTAERTARPGTSDTSINPVRRHPIASNHDRAPATGGVSSAPTPSTEPDASERRTQPSNQRPDDAASTRATIRASATPRCAACRRAFNSTYASARRTSRGDRNTCRWNRSRNTAPRRPSPNTRCTARTTRTVTAFIPHARSNAEDASTIRCR